MEKAKIFQYETLAKERPGRIGGKREQNRKKRIEVLCQAAVELFLERGVERVTIQEITEKAGVAKGSFYRYFKNKSELIEVLYAPLYGELEEAFEACEEVLKVSTQVPEMIAAYEKLGEALIGSMLMRLDRILLYLQESRGPQAPTKKKTSEPASTRKGIHHLTHLITEKCVSLAEAAQSHGLLRPIHPRVSALIVIGAVERLLFGFLSGEELGNPLEISQTLIELVIQGLQAKPV